MTHDMRCQRAGCGLPKSDLVHIPWAGYSTDGHIFVASREPDAPRCPQMRSGTCDGTCVTCADRDTETPHAEPESAKCRECGREHSGLTDADTPTLYCEDCAPKAAASSPETATNDALTYQPPVTERYYCGCVRVAKWTRCEDHTGLHHEAEPPLRARVRATPTPSEPTTDQDCEWMVACITNAIREGRDEPLTDETLIARNCAEYLHDLFIRRRALSTETPQ